MRTLTFIIICVATIFSLVTLFFGFVAVVLTKQQGKPEDHLKQKLKHFAIRDFIYLVILWSLWWLICQFQ